jgi:23S rRNA (uracil1939-C5)-methyltransferase
MTYKPSLPHHHIPRLITTRLGNTERIFSKSPCKIQDICESCPSLHIPYRAQIQQKTKLLKQYIDTYSDVFSKSLIRECAESPDKLGYRHTAKLVVSERPSHSHKRWIEIGLYQPNSHTVLDIGSCPVQANKLNSITAWLRTALRDYNISIYTPKNKQGLLRYIGFKMSHTTKQVLVTFVISHSSLNELKPLARGLAAQFIDIEGVLVHVNEQPGNAIFTEEIGNTILLTGKDTLTEKFNHLTFQFSSASFMQSNPQVAELMYKQISEYADLTGKERVLDLYCGAGTISLHLARHAASVIGIEENPSSVYDANRNALMNNLKNIEFHEGRVEELLPSLISRKQLSFIDFISLNPSRKGCHPQALRSILDLSPKNIAYMSCYPETLLRDLKILVEGGYKVLSFEPFDMFPGTSHYEVLALLTRD